MGGEAPYVLCQLVLTGNTQLIMAAGSHIRIIFDSPENCGLPSGTAQMQIENSGRIVSKSFSPGSGNYSAPGFYFVGSPAQLPHDEGDHERRRDRQQHDHLRARTEIAITNGASFGGAILGKTVYLDGGTRTKPEGTGSFNPDENLPVEPTGPGTYTQGSYVECTATANETEPSTGC